LTKKKKKKEKKTRKISRKLPNRKSLGKRRGIFTDGQKATNGPAAQKAKGANGPAKKTNEKKEEESLREREGAKTFSVKGRGRGEHHRTILS